MRRFALATALYIAALSPAQTRPASIPASQPELEGLAAIRAEANELAPLLKSELARRFVASVESLPAIAPREFLRDPQTRRFYAKASVAALPEETQTRLRPDVLDESYYYTTRYGTPLAYSRALDLLAEHGFTDLAGKRVLDFGYGNIGQLKLMASLGADMVGVDVDPNLLELYSEPSDQGRVAGRHGRDGSVKLVCGRWPAEEDAKAAVGGDFDLILSKNTLKNGYINPERPVDKRMLVDLGVDAQIYVKTLHASLRPGGRVMIYNICPAPSKPEEPYKPWADGRCPFPREMWTSAGFTVIEFDVIDDEAVRRMGHALGWDAGERPMDLAHDLFAWWTLVEKSR
ncbi:MAG: hypothetical protein U1D55_15755 [Phycisphaerae bacterium]